MPPEVIESIRQLKRILSRQPRAVQAGGAVGILLLGWFIYAPALTGIRQSHEEWIRLKNELSAIRETVEPIRRGEIPLLLSAEATPALLEQLNTLARSKQIQFIQVSPGTPRPGELSGLMILPIDLMLEGSYRSLGEFLGALRQTPSLRGTFVRRLSIDREERLLPRLRGRLSLEIFLSGAENGS